MIYSLFKMQISKNTGPISTGPPTKLHEIRSFRHSNSGSSIDFYHATSFYETFASKETIHAPSAWGRTQSHTSSSRAQLQRPSGKGQWRGSTGRLTYNQTYQYKTSYSEYQKLQIKPKSSTSSFCSQNSSFIAKNSFIKATSTSPTSSESSEHGYSQRSTLRRWKIKNTDSTNGNKSTQPLVNNISA